MVHEKQMVDLVHYGGLYRLQIIHFYPIISLQ